ncbi:ATPase expression protein 3 [Wickerhamomyces ciferrii]|uniref:ATPase expression protein 3 n=1 Tax=Wickerhamomyces ciferrii (strain ATCC 14091 / BCRC 22168 / CBS 111 / JCM 3599 / NBRC 0793 / NRRL Y-1031 F-60-10) TaxID=1206466 RepID=K0KFU3_WICCF|nr:ATPase expression protein 3 [Wickerhamomyces ciferrii]CCH41766.1 ATPase expression protein 3 [Wickerhamomyces ciferrii]
MSLVKTFRDFLVRCREKSLIVPKSGSDLNYFPNHLINEIKELPTTQHKEALPPPFYLQEGFSNEASMVKAYYSAVGKGSMFERRMVEDHLRALGPTSLRRSNIENSKDFDKEAAESQIYGQKLKMLADDPESQFNLNQALIRQILETLVIITPKAKNPNQISPIKLDDPVTKTRKIQSNSYTEIPPMPEFGDDVKLFENYIFTLTHCTFHYKKSSKFNGIIPKLLKNLFHPLNSSTIPLRTTQSYNDAIHFFAKKWNISTCNELLVQMELENVSQNTTTFNILLKTLLTSKHIRHSVNPYEVAVMKLKEMQKKGIDADVVTWNIIYNLLEDEISKKLLLENRTMSMVPMDQFLIKAILNDLALKNGINGRNIIEIIESFQLPIDEHLINITLKSFTQENQFLPAWLIVEYCDKESGLNPGVPHLNMFLAPISEMGRIDLMVATLNTFKKRFKVRPNFDSYNLIMKCISRSLEWDGKSSVLRIFYHQMMGRLKNCQAGEYWIRRIRAREKMIYDRDVKLSTPLTTKEIELSNEMQILRWNFDVKIKDFESRLPQKFPELVAKLGYKVLKHDNLHESKNIDNIEHRKELAKKYKGGISNIAIMKSMAKRVPYAINSYKALQNELQERKILK